MDSRLTYVSLADSMADRVRCLAADSECCPVLIDRSADDRTWLVCAVRDNGPLEYRLTEPGTGRTKPLLLNRPDLQTHRMPSLRDFTCVASDGLHLTGYSLAPLTGSAPWPTVLMVHGGPGGRDLWRFHAEAQYLAALGYASIHLNYRGSTGFGRRFRLLANGEWGRKMQSDLYDAIAAAISSGLADPDRIAFFGASYGGYAALLAAITRPDLLRCAVAISPLTDLVSLAFEPPPYWRPLAGALQRQILGDAEKSAVATEASVRERSPSHLLGPGTAPLLIAHGVRDPRVSVTQIDAFVDRCTVMGVPVRYLRFPDEGHHVHAAENRLKLFAEIDSFFGGAL